MFSDKNRATKRQYIISQRNFRLGEWAASLLGLRNEAREPDELGNAEEYAYTFFGKDCQNIGPVCGIRDFDTNPLSDEEVLRKLVEDLAVVGITEKDVLVKMKSLLQEVKLEAG